MKPLYKSKKVNFTVIGSVLTVIGGYLAAKYPQYSNEVALFSAIVALLFGNYVQVEGKIDAARVAAGKQTPDAQASATVTVEKGGEG